MPEQSRTPKPISDTPIDALRPMKVICIGAGLSGILTGIRFPQKIQNLELTIYEKNADIGGTWYENRYPGIACDIPAHTYQFTFASNPTWSHFYAPGQEIWHYLKDVAHKYDVEKYVRCQHLFQKAEWRDNKQKWEVTIKDLVNDRVFIDSADVLLKGTGILNTWNWPDIPGLHGFKGKLLHSADWDPNFEVSGKRLALIGGGSSGIQILPKIQPTAKHVYHYMKGKTWISPVGYGAEDNTAQDSTGNVEHSAEELQMFAADPSEYRRYRHRIEGGMNRSQLVTFRGTDIQRMFWTMTESSMKQKLAKKPHIYEALKPDFPPGCRRLTPGPGYLEALVEDNVDFISCGIKRISEHGIEDNEGNYHELDAIICATGFDTSYKQDATPIIGLYGKKLEQLWDPFPEAYMSLATPMMPNLFFYLGPNGGPAAGSFVHLLECVAGYVIKCVQKLQLEYIGSMTVCNQANKAFSAYVDQYFAKTIFTYSCKSWFKRNIADGRVVALWPGSSVHAYEALRNPRFEDFEYVLLPETRENPLCWFGNGMTVAQEQDTMTTQYLDEVDIPPIINKRLRVMTNGVHCSQDKSKGVEIVTMPRAISTLPS